MQFGCIQRLDFTVLHFIPIDMHFFFSRQRRLLLMMRERARVDRVNNNKNQLDALIVRCFFFFFVTWLSSKNLVYKCRQPRQTYRQKRLISFNHFQWKIGIKFYYTRFNKLQIE